MNQKTARNAVVLCTSFFFHCVTSKKYTQLKFNKVAVIYSIFAKLGENNLICWSTGATNPILGNTKKYYKILAF